MTVECPLPRTHKRLADVYALWQEVLLAYPDPETFRRRLNSLIQETRNVTFRLQAEKHGIPDFDPWYADWRRRMESVEEMKWAVEMRNQVVKQGDLETRSLARVSLYAEWDNPPAKEIELPPMIGPHQIAEKLKHTGIPPELLRDAIAVVERRWVVDSLPSREVLDALADCYSVLYELVEEAHGRCGAALEQDAVEVGRPTWTKDEKRQDRPSNMALFEEVRTARLRLATGEWLRVERENMRDRGAGDGHACPALIGYLERLPVRDAPAVSALELVLAMQHAASPEPEVCVARLPLFHGRTPPPLDCSAPGGVPRTLPIARGRRLAASRRS